VARHAEQERCIRRFMAATALDPKEWSHRGYADAFDRLWESKVRDHETIYALTIATCQKVSTSLDRKTPR
jgi:hypothetical protein